MNRQKHGGKYMRHRSERSAASKVVGGVADRLLDLLADEPTAKVTQVSTVAQPRIPIQHVPTHDGVEVTEDAAPESAPVVDEVAEEAVTTVADEAAEEVDEEAEEPTELALPYALTFTIILVASSFTCQMGVFAAERGDVFGLRRWYAISFLLGLIFVIGQANEFRTMVSEGTTLASSAYGSVFYITTGFHGLHVIGGLVAFIFLILRTKMSKFTPAQATASIVVSYYWHFVDIVWIGLFLTIYIIR